MLKSRKTLAAALALCMLLALMPSAALAAGSGDKTGTFSYSGTDVGAKQNSYSYNDADFTSSAYTYSQHLATMSLDLAMAAFSTPGTPDNGYTAEYAGKNVSSLLTDVGFGSIDVSTYGGKPTANSIAYAIGEKQIASGSESSPLTGSSENNTAENSTLIAVAVRGGGYESEWAGNFTLTGSSDDHDGFSTAADQVLSGIKSYIAANGITGRVKIWVTGYSRAAATANLVASRLDRGEITSVTGDGVFAYTFETPQNTKALSAHSSTYSNIFNIVDPIDIVTKVVPGAWSYTRYGRDMFLPSAETDPNYSKYDAAVAKTFDSLTGQSVSSVPQLSCQSALIDNVMDILASALGGDNTAATAEVLSQIRETLLSSGDTSGEGVMTTMFSKLAASSSVSMADKMRLYAAVKPLQSGMDTVFVAHYPELCLAWMTNISGEQDYCEGSYRTISVTSSASSSLTDAGGKAVASTTLGANTLYSFPTAGEYTLKVSASADGSITCSSSEYNLETGMNTLTASYSVSAKTGDSYTGNAADGSNTAYPGFTLSDKSGAPLKASCAFTDVTAGSDPYTMIMWALSSRITSGVTETTFEPDADCTRAQAMTFLWRAVGCPEPTSSANPFTDVSSSDYYYKAVLWAYQNGVTEGKTASLFAPGDLVSRCEFITFLWRALGKPSGSGAAFTDVPADSYYAPAVSWGVGKDIVHGTAYMIFSPYSNCLRYQTVTFLCRVYAAD